LNNELKIVSCERDALVVSNDAFQDDIIFKKNKFKEYKQSSECKRLNEVKNMITCLSSEVTHFKKEVITLNKTLNVAKHNIEAFNMQLTIHYNEQQ